VTANEAFTRAVKDRISDLERAIIAEQNSVHYGGDTKRARSWSADARERLERTIFDFVIDQAKEN